MTKWNILWRKWLLHPLGIFYNWWKSNNSLQATVRAEWFPYHKWTPCGMQWKGSKVLLVCCIVPSTYSVPAILRTILTCLDKTSETHAAVRIQTWYFTTWKTDDWNLLEKYVLSDWKKTDDWKRKSDTWFKK